MSTEPDSAFDEGAEPQAGDADFNDAIPSVDPQGTERRNEIDVENAAEIGGVAAQWALDREEQERKIIDTLQAVRDLSFAEEIEWRISRKGEEEPRMNGFLVQWPASSTTLERIQRKFGGGKFYLYGVRNGRYFKHMTLQIAGEPKNPKDEPTVTKDSSAPIDFQSFMLQQQQLEDRRRERDREEADRRRRED